MNPEHLSKTRSVWPTLGSKSPTKKVGANRHLETSWASQLIDCLVVNWPRKWPLYTQILCCLNWDDIVRLLWLYICLPLFVNSFCNASTTVSGWGGHVYHLSSCPLVRPLARFCDELSLLHCWEFNETPLQLFYVLKCVNAMRWRHNYDSVTPCLSCSKFIKAVSSFLRDWFEWRWLRDECHCFMDRLLLLTPKLWQK